MRHWCFFLVFSISALKTHSQHESLESSSIQGRFDRARIAFENGDWPTAITTYQGLMTDGVQTWALNFNLGKSLYKNNEPGPAMFHLERARILAPNNSEIKELLSQVREDFDVPNYNLRTWERWARWFTPNFWIGTLSIAGWITLISFLLPQITKFSFYKTNGFYIIQVFSALFVIASTAGFLVTRNWYREGIVTDDEVTLKLAPTQHSPELRGMIPGEKTRIQKSARNHLYIVASDGSSGWIKAEHVDLLWE